MKTKLIGATFLCAFIASPVLAQKYKTDIPASIITPDTVETRLGTLKFTDGFPDDATVQKAYDNLDFQRATQAFLTSMPAASMVGIRKGLRNFGPDNNTVVLFEQLMDSRSLFLTANTESVYAWAWLDLKNGPVVIESPTNTLGIINNFWFRYVGDLGNAGPDKGKGGKFLVLPPGYKGDVPQGYYVFTSPTFGNAFLSRGFLVNGDPKPAAESFKKTLRIYPLAQAAKPPATNFVNGSGKAMNTIHSMDVSFFDEVNEVVQEEPSDAIDPETLGLLASIGMEKGKPFAPDERMKKILVDAAAVGSATARTIAYKSRDDDFFYFPGKSNWRYAFVGGSYQFEHDGARLLDPRTFFFFEGTFVTPAMAVKQPAGVGSQYAFTVLDANGRPFDGAKTYRLHLPPNIPVKDFWSIVLYDTQTRSMLQTDQQFPSISSQKAGIVINPDTSVDLYFGPTPPSGKEANWVQTIPGKGWGTLFRLYGPLQPWFDRTWRLGEIEEVKGATSISQGSATPKYRTDIPPSIITPNTLETRIGTLKFTDGFPDDATVQKVYDNLDFQRATLAFLRGIPPANQVGMRGGIRSFGPDNQTIVLFETLMDSRGLFLTANSDTVYAIAWLNLKDGPVVVESPPNTLGLVDDFWYRYVADLGNVGPDKGKGGKFLFLPSGYNGPVPTGYYVFRSPTFNNWFGTRGFLVNGDPAPAAAAFRQHLKIYPLSQAANPPANTFVNGSGKHFNTIHAMDVSFFNELNQVVQEEPTMAGDPETLGLLASIGIEKGKPFAPDERMKKILTEAAAVGSTTVRTMSYRSRDKEAKYYPDSAWSTLFIGGSYEWLRNDARPLDARTFFFFYATTNSPAIAVKMVGAGSQYAVAWVDSKGQPFDGGKTYRLHLPPNIPAKNFWSITLYDNQTRSLLQTDVPHPSIGSHSKGIVINPDTSADLYIGPKPPAGKESNWVQSVPGKGYSVMLRLYGPGESWFDKTWRPGEIGEVK